MMYPNLLFSNVIWNLPVRLKFQWALHPVSSIIHRVCWSWNVCGNWSLLEVYTFLWGSYVPVFSPPELQIPWKLVPTGVVSLPSTKTDQAPLQWYIFSTYSLVSFNIINPLSETSTAVTAKALFFLVRDFILPHQILIYFLFIILYMAVIDSNSVLFLGVSIFS